MSERVAVPGASSWIVSPAWDFSFLIASPLVIIPVMAILASEAVTPEHLALAVFAFATVGHHLPGYMRAYGDRALFRRFRTRFLLAPVLLFAATLTLTDPRRIGLDEAVLTAPQLLILLWGTWHGLMQVYGFMRIYDAKQGNERGLTQRLDLALCIGLFAGGMLFSDSRMFRLLDLVGHSGLPLPSAEALAAVRMVAAVALGVLVAGYVANAWIERQGGRRFGGVKLVLALSAGGIYTFAGLLTTNVLVGLAMFEVYHALQYYGIVWVFNRKARERAGDDFGPLGFLFRDRWSMLALYVASIAAFGVGLIWLLLPSTGIPSATPTTTDWDFLGPLLAAVYSTSGLLHYYYDGFIWKVRDRDIARDLSARWQGAGQLSVPAMVHAGKWLLLAVVMAGLIWSDLSGPRGADAERSHLTRLAALLPRVPELLTRRIAVALKEGDAAGALEMAELSVSLRPRAAFAHADLADARWATGDLDGAAESLAAVIELVPDDLLARASLARALAGAGPKRRDEAVAAYEDAIQHAPAATVLRRELAALHAERGDRPAAIAEYRRVLAEEPDAHGVRQEVVRLLAAAGRVPAALQLARQGAAEGPEVALAHMTLGWALLEAGHPGEALEALQRSATLDAGLPGLNLELARAELATGRLAEAEESLARVFAATAGEATPPAAHFYASVVYDRSERPAAAARHRAAFLGRFAHPVAGHRRLGELLVQTGDFAGAEKSYREVLALAPQNAEAHAQLGMLLQRRGAIENARFHLSRARMLGARLPPAGHALIESSEPQSPRASR